MITDAYIQLVDFFKETTCSFYGMIWCRFSKISFVQYKRATESYKNNFRFQSLLGWDFKKASDILRFNHFFCELWIKTEMLDLRTAAVSGQLDGHREKQKNPV